MRSWYPLVASLVVLASTVVSGTLECNPQLSPELAHGREIYSRMCAVCHGEAGEGYKADQAPALANPDFLGSVSDEFLVSAITHGRAGSTMSAWGVEHSGPLVAPEVLAVVAFLRSWGPAAPPKLDDRPIEGDAVHGKELYAHECAVCHGVRGTGGPYESIGNPQLLTFATNGFLRHAIRNGRANTLMRGFHASLGDAQIEDVIALLRSWQSDPSHEPVRLAAPAKPPPLPLGPVPLHPGGPEPVGFASPSGFTKADVIHEQLVRGAKMALLDARAPSDYTQEHIEGAVSVPFYDPDPYVNQLPRDAWLVAYCGCPHAESGQLAAKLRAKGFTKVTVLDEGLRYWSSKFGPKGTGAGEGAKKFGTRKGTLP